MSAWNVGKNASTVSLLNRNSNFLTLDKTRTNPFVQGRLLPVELIIFEFSRCFVSSLIRYNYIDARVLVYSIMKHLMPFGLLSIIVYVYLKYIRHVTVFAVLIRLIVLTKCNVSLIINSKCNF